MQVRHSPPWSEEGWLCLFMFGSEQAIDWLIKPQLAELNLRESAIWPIKLAGQVWWPTWDLWVSYERDSDKR